MDLFRGTRAKDRRTTLTERRITSNERRITPSEHRTYKHKRGTQLEDSLRIPSWHASDHPSLSVTSSDHPSSSVTWHASDRSSWHASYHSPTSPVIYHNCRCSSACPVRGPSASRGGNHSTCRGGDHTSCDQPSCPPCRRPLSQTYGTPSDQLRRADYHHRGSTFSFHGGWLLSLRDDRLTSSDAHRHSTSEDDLFSSSGASRPESTYHNPSQDRRWKVLLQDTIRRLVRSLVPGRPRSLDIRQIHTLSKRALGDIVRQAMKLCKLDLVRKGSDLDLTEDSSTAGDSSATMLEGPTAGENAMERSVPSFLPSFLPSYPRRNTYADPRVWLASEGGDRIGDAGSLREDAGDLREDAGGLVDNDHTGGIGEDAGAVCYVAGDAPNFDDPCGFEVYAGGSVNDPSSLNDDNNASTISLLNGEPLAGSNISSHASRTFSHSSRRACSGSSSTPYSHSSSRIEVWIAEVIGSHRGARENPPHYQGARENPSRGASKHVAWDVGKYEGPSMAGRKTSSTPGRKTSSTSQPKVLSTPRNPEQPTSRGKERAVPKAVAAQIIAIVR
ncbi:hypothetical protein EV122DRAFT_206675 [Schizophyllum commune]